MNTKEVPDPHNPLLTKLAREVGAKCLKIIPHKPRVDSTPMNCLKDVFKQIQEHGGALKLAASLFEIKGGFFWQTHAIWKSAAGELIDVSNHHGFDGKGEVLVALF